MAGWKRAAGRKGSRAVWLERRVLRQALLWAAQGQDRSVGSGQVRSGQVRCCLREAHNDMETMDGVPCGYASSVVVAPSIQVHGGHTLAERKKQRPLCGRELQSGIRAGQCSAVQCLRCGVEHRSCLSVEPALWLSLLENIVAGGRSFAGSPGGA